MAAGLLNRVLGADLPGQARGPLVSIGINFAALSVFATFFGLWLVGPLGANAQQVSTGYFAAGMAGIAGGYLGGRLTDRFGPRPVIFSGSGLQVVLATSLFIPGIGVGPACAVLVAMTFLQPLRGVAQRIALADAGPESARDELFAGYRLVVNLGSILGPALGAGMVGISWTALHLEVAVLYVLSFLFSLGLRTGAQPQRHPGQPRSLMTAAIFTDWRLYALMFATTSAWTVVYTYETVLPVALTQSYGLSPTEWGLVYALGPVLVVLFQLRVTRWITAVRADLRLAAGTALMGAAFLVMVLGGALWLVVILVIVFVVGDMMWGPASEVATLRVAPPHQRGAYVGVLTSAIWLGSALAPAIGFPLREQLGDNALWGAVLVLGLVSGAAYVATDFFASRTVKRESSW